MKPGYKGPETEAEFATEIEALPKPLSYEALSRLESVSHGWSLEGHWYVQIKTGANGIYGDHIVCATETQAHQIAECLRPLTEV